MNALWSINLDTLQEFHELIDTLEKDMKRELNDKEKEIVFLQLMKEKNIKPTGNTELNKEEFIKEYVSHGKTILNIDKDGMKIIKPKEKE